MEDDMPDWRELYNQGRYRLAALRMRIAPEADDVDCLLALGSLLLYGLHLFETEQDYIRFMTSTDSIAKRQFFASNRSYEIEGVDLLERASAKGSLIASENLATYYLMPHEYLTEEVRSNRAKYYHDRSQLLHRSDPPVAED